MGKKGFTLIEVLLVATIFAAVAALMFTLLGQGLTLYTIETSSADEQQGLRQVFSDITNSIRLTDINAIEAKGDSLTVGNNTYALSGQSVLKNNTAIAERITVFEAEIDKDALLLNLTIKNTKGATLQTSLSLAK